MLLIRLKLRSLMIILVPVAATLAIAVAVYHQLAATFPTSPASWARQQARLQSELDVQEGGYSKSRSSSPLRRRLEQLAISFERFDVPWSESTINGPYTDFLPNGQLVFVHVDGDAQFADLQGRVLKDVDKLIAVSRGSNGIVVKDWATDADACSPHRYILIRLKNGKNLGRILRIERVYLRRGS